MIRRFKDYLWRKAEAKLRQWARCRQCRNLVRFEKANGEDDQDVLSQHPGHVLDSVITLNLREWVRVMAA